MLYPRVITIKRSQTIASATNRIGLQGYSGMAENPDASDTQQGEIVIASAVPASIQATQQGRKKDSSLPSDAVWAPTWVIYIPKSAVAKGVIRDRDIAYDDEGYRYEVGQAYWNILGHKLTGIRLEA